MLSSQYSPVFPLKLRCIKLSISIPGKYSVFSIINFFNYFYPAFLFQKMEIQASDNKQELLKRIRKGDVKAFDLIFEEYSQRLYGFAFSMLKNHEDAREIVQETFLKVWNKRKEINTNYSFKSYLFSISYNIIIDLLRKKSNDSKYQKYLKDHFNVALSGTDEQVNFNELQENLTQLLEKLPEKRRAIYKMSREEGFSHKEIAEKMGISIKTVENQINLSLKFLKENLGTDKLIVLLFLALFV